MKFLEVLLFSLVVLFVLVGVPVLTMLAFEWLTPVARKASRLKLDSPTPRFKKLFIKRSNKLFKKFLASYSHINCHIESIKVCGNEIVGSNDLIFNLEIETDCNILGKTGIWEVSSGLPLRKHIEIQTIYLIGVVNERYWKNATWGNLQEGKDYYLNEFNEVFDDRPTFTKAN